MSAAQTVAGFVSRQITLIFQIGNGHFGLDAGATITVAGLRVTANIEMTSSGPSGSLAQIRVYGLDAKIANSISSLNKKFDYQSRNNRVTIMAGDAVNGMGVAFAGNISDSWVDPAGSPDVSCNITAHTAEIFAMAPVPATSFQGSASVATLMGVFAALMSLSLENSGVTGITLSNPYYHGTALEQATRCAREAQIIMFIDPVEKVLAIWPKGGSRNGTVPLISPTTGMAGYPCYTGGGISVTTLYNPSIRLGCAVQIANSILPQANGRWVINASLSHELSSETPDGRWHTTFQALNNDQSG